MSLGSNQAIRPSAIAGRWYPGDAAGLRRTVSKLISAVATSPAPGRVLALVAPHAGYSFSGATAASAFAQVQAAAYSRVVMLGPLHRPVWGSRLGALMTPVEEAYRTPLGDVPVDRDFADRLAGHVTLTSVQGDEEHSLEIELPFLQVVLGNFSLVPVMLGEHVSEPGVGMRLEKLAAALAEMWDDHTLLVVSTDLSHLDNYQDVVRTDKHLVELMANSQIDEAIAALEDERAHACGGAGLDAALRFARLLGATATRVLQYTTSGDVTGEKGPGVYTVGYMAAAVYR